MTSDPVSPGPARSDWNTDGPVPWPLVAGVAAAVLVVSLVAETVGLTTAGVVVTATVVVARRPDTEPATWAAGALAAGGAAVQAALAGHVAYLTRAVDPSYGWGGLLLIYTVPVVAVATAAWAGMRLRRAGRGWAAVVGACLAAVVWSVAVAVVGSQIGDAVAAAA